MGTEVGSSKEKAMSEKIKSYLTNEHKLKFSSGVEYLKCNAAVCELKLSGGIILDVVGFSKKDKTFCIVECKRGANAKDIGNAIGQILAYRWILDGRGYELFSNFFDRLKNEDLRIISLDDIHGIEESGKFQCRFLVGLVQRACSKYKLLRLLKTSIKPEIGIIRYRESKGKGKCELHIHTEQSIEDYDICRSEPAGVEYRKKYTREEFLERVQERFFENDNVRRLVKSTTKSSRLYQYRFGRSAFHFEVGVLKGNSITISLDVEPKKKRYKEDFFDFVEPRKQLIRKTLGWEPFYQRNWLKEGTWGRIGTSTKYELLDDQTANKTANCLVGLVRCLKPVVDEFQP
jgi:hypothetical protein